MLIQFFFIYLNLTLLFNRFFKVTPQLTPANYEIIIMGTFLLDVTAEIKRHSQKNDELTLLTNKRWVLIDEKSNNKTIFIFRGNEDLLISTNGKVEKAKWEYFGNHLFMIDKEDDKFSFKLNFCDQNIMVSRLTQWLAVLLLILPNYLRIGLN